MPLELLEFQVFRSVQTFKAGQTAEIDLPMVPLDQIWRIEEISVAQFVAAATPNGPSVVIFDQANPGPTAVPVQITTLSTYPGYGAFGLQSPIGNVYVDIDDGSTPITVRGGDQLAIVFLAGNTAVACGVRVQYSIYQGVAGKPQPYAGGGPAPSIPAGL